MLDILDSLIATIGVVLVLSLIVQAIQQIIKQAFDLKTDYMRQELVSMFVDDWTKETGTDPVATLKEASRQQVEHLVGALELKMKGIGFKDLELLENVDAVKLKEIFHSVPIEEALNAAGGKVLLLRKEIGNEIDRWFDLAKQAFQDHYERRMKVWAFGIAAVIVIAMNVNLFDTYTLFSTNSAAREAGLSLATSLGKISADSLMKVMAVDTGTARSDSLIQEGIRQKCRFVESLVEDKTFQFFGWRGAALAKLESRSVWENVFIIPLGWLAMALLVSLGAPFWYDVLKSLMGVKNLLKNKTDGSADVAAVAKNTKK
jgi:hypothetical protein